MQENVQLAKDSKLYQKLWADQVKMFTKERNSNGELSKKLAEFRKHVLECNNLAKDFTTALEQAELRLQE